MEYKDLIQMPKEFKIISYSEDTNLKLEIFYPTKKANNLIRNLLKQDKDDSFITGLFKGVYKINSNDFYLTITTAETTAEYQKKVGLYFTCTSEGKKLHSLFLQIAMEKIRNLINIDKKKED